MKKRFFFAVCAGSLVAAACLADLIPELLTANFYRTNAVASVQAPSYFRGTTVRLTNCVAFAAGGATQNLTNVGIIIRAGNSTTNLQVYGKPQVAADGTFTADALLPASGGAVMKIQLRLTNGPTIYIYPELEIAVEGAI
jgi:hypothetical protein